MASTSLPIVQPGESTDLIMGIDLGTTFSLAAVVIDGSIRILRDETGDARIPSVIAFLPDGQVAVGQEARARAVRDPGHTAYSIKRLIGRTRADVERDLAYVPYQITERTMADGRAVLTVTIDGREHTPEELSAMVLREVVKRVDDQLGPSTRSSVRRAVITVPAYFDESQRQATRDAGRMAGLDVVRIVNEPTAAALAYGLQERSSGKIAVYDFGGGTFDCSLLDLKDGVFRVLSTHGDTHLGGDDIDRAIMQRTAEEWGIPLEEMDLNLKESLREASEKLKIDLSKESSAMLRVDARSYEKPWTRQEFDDLIAPLIDRTIKATRSAIRDAGLAPADIDEVVLVGGSSRIALVRERVEALFGRPPHVEINPDEVVAAGAAVQGSILAGQLRQVLLLDITPLSLGIETMGGAVSRLIARNSTIPVQATERFTTFVDNQTGVEIHVVQGERELAKDCRSLGKFKLGGLPPMPAGLPQIDVTFLIDANGMLQITAKEIRSNQSASIDIQPTQGLARDEVERMIKESIENAKKDYAERQWIDLRNKAETNTRATQRGLAQAGSQLDADQQSAIEQALLGVTKALEAGVSGDLQRALDDLDRVTQPLAVLLMDSVAQSQVTGKKLDDA